MIATRPSLFAGPGTACGLPEPLAAGLAQTCRGCFRFKCELNEEKNVSLGNSIGARSSDRCWSLLSHRACVLLSRIANYFRGPATAKEEKEVAGVVLGGGVWGRCCGQRPLHTLLKSADILDQGLPCPLLGFCSLWWALWRRQQGLWCQHCFDLMAKTLDSDIWDMNCLCLVGPWVAGPGGGGRKMERTQHVSSCVPPKLSSGRASPWLRCVYGVCVFGTTALCGPVGIPYA